jgi:hypothetical protein
VSERIEAPAGFITQHALAFGAENGSAVGVDADHPLPVATIRSPATATRLEGILAASATIGPFVPDLDRPIWVTLAGNWTGRVSVLRSLDGGTTKLPLTAGGRSWGSFTANAQEAIGEENMPEASYWLFASITSGTLTYQVAQ